MDGEELPWGSHGEKLKMQAMDQKFENSAAQMAAYLRKANIIGNTTITIEFSNIKDYAYFEADFRMNLAPYMQDKYKRFNTQDEFECYGIKYIIKHPVK